MKKNWFLALVVFIICFSFGLSLAFSTYSLGNVIKDNREDSATLYARDIASMLGQEMAQPIAIAQSMDNVNTRRIMLKESGQSDQEVISELTAYLSDLTRQMGYYSAFIADDASKAFITDQGFNRFMDTSVGSDDDWYMNFKNSGKEYELNVDNDQYNNNRMTAYINYRMEDEDGNFIGVCGVGIKLDDLTDVLEQYEKDGEYAIFLCSEDGAIQLTSEVKSYSKYTSSSNQGQASDYIQKSISEYSKTDREEELFVQRKGNAFYLIKYIEDMNWYLVIEYQGSKGSVYSTTLQQNLMLYIVSFFIIILILAIVMRIYTTKTEEYERIQREQEMKLTSQLEMIGSMANMYFCIYYVDLRDGTFVEVNSIDKRVDEVIGESGDAQEKMDAMAKFLVVPEQAEMIHEFTKISTVRERLKNKDYIATEFIGVHSGWSEGVFIAADRDDEGYCNHCIWAIRVIQDIKDREQVLIDNSNTDELTQINNRKLYEENLAEYAADRKKEDFVYIAIDINGLKTANDTLGHKAGDELIIATAKCMKQVLAPYGRIYRIGGDEFAAMIFADGEKLEFLRKDLYETVNAWKGNQVEHLSIAIGTATKSEFPTLSVIDLAKIADKRMYEDKASHYSQIGIDRRGQQDAMNAISCAYTKILKVNLSTDEYHIVFMNINEQTEELGFSRVCSEWIRNFAEVAVYSEDVRNYLEKTDFGFLKQHFAESDDPVLINYRRRILTENTDGTHSNAPYKEVVMEIRKTEDYDKNQQTVFLYVR